MFIEQYGIIYHEAERFKGDSECQYVITSYGDF